MFYTLIFLFYQTVFITCQFLKASFDLFLIFWKMATEEFCSALFDYWIPDYNLHSFTNSLAARSQRVKAVVPIDAGWSCFHRPSDFPPLRRVAEDEEGCENGGALRMLFVAMVTYVTLTRRSLPIGDHDDCVENGLLGARMKEGLSSSTKWCKWTDVLLECLLISWRQTVTRPAGFGTSIDVADP